MKEALIDIIEKARINYWRMSGKEPTEIHMTRTMQRRVEREVAIHLRHHDLNLDRFTLMGMHVVISDEHLEFK